MPVKKVIIDKASRLYQMAPDILDFVQPENRYRLLKRPELLDLGSFVWPLAYDTQSPPDADSLRPASSERLNNLKEEIAGWIATCHHVGSITEKEIFVGGSITSLIHALSFAYLDNGDIAFVPGLGIPLYRQAVTACGGEPVSYAVAPGNTWHPSLERVQTRLGRIARLLFVNSPHNPTGAVLGEKEMSDLVWLASRENILIINDAAYQGIAAHLPTSLLSVPGGKKVGVEVYSIPYQFGLPSVPLGFVVGNREVIRGLKTTSRLMPHHIPDYFVTIALQAIRRFPSETLVNQRNEFRRISAEANRLLERLSLERSGFDTVPFIWARITRRGNSVTAARTLLRRHRILVVPGTGFGETGQGYLRFSLTAGYQRFVDAASRVSKKMKLTKSEESD